MWVLVVVVVVAVGLPKLWIAISFERHHEKTHMKTWMLYIWQDPHHTRITQPKLELLIIIWPILQAFLAMLGVFLGTIKSVSQSVSQLVCRPSIYLPPLSLDKSYILKSSHIWGRHRSYIERVNGSQDWLPLPPPSPQHNHERIHNNAYITIITFSSFSFCERPTEDWLILFTHMKGKKERKSC